MTRTSISARDSSSGPPNRFRRPVVLVACIGVGAITAGAHFHRPGQPQPRVEQGVRNNNELALTQEVAALRREVSALRSSTASAARDVNGAEAPPEEPLPGAGGEARPPPRRDLEQKAAAENKRIALELEKVFTTEPIDAAWSLETTRTIRGALGTGLEGARVEEAGCASSLCRIVFTHTAPDGQRELSGRIDALDTFKTGLFFDYDKESTPPRTTLYVLREGRPFPDMRQSGL